MTEPDIYLVSDDEEAWTCPDEFSTREAAVEYGREEYPDKVFWTGVKGPPEHVTIDAGQVVDWLRERAAEECEFAGEWLDKVTPEQERELEAGLNAVFGEWMAKHGHRPTWWSVGEVREHGQED